MFVHGDALIGYNVDLMCHSEIGKILQHHTCLENFLDTSVNRAHL